MVSVLNKENVWELLESIPDPEIPVISIVDLGIIRSVDISDQKTLVTITPTYSGCPAMFEIESQIKEVLSNAGIGNLELKTVLAPAWTTDWINAEAKKKLEEYGIAPPKPGIFSEDTLVACPFCKSENTSVTSVFGSTPCKALFYCNSCEQPFEHFKCH
ncbi:MAG: phenylacetate-CoA oxygenase subunit PaaJ [Bacteroidia bacterium]|nr:phenylacetate-CoA oxygenase subunit PaaJ [Bacteroidia bacterium]NNC84497.1 phenylacetate-CoA oxygenase subunit PaaJ [Bacteroidia bacterium]NNM15967.1 phenylacetate-CoA oxygenase subunit PaaJ [Bacteroidia bacterium]